MTNVYNTLTKTEFSVYIDKRYDIEYIKKQVLELFHTDGVFIAPSFVFIAVHED